MVSPEAYLPMEEIASVSLVIRVMLTQSGLASTQFPEPIFIDGHRSLDAPLP